ncbi:Nanos -like protein 1 [Halotydeus destructor]|nr:Nanos -like protein 1 [Halotydeus destructor]
MDSFSSRRPPKFDKPLELAEIKSTLWNDDVGEADLPQMSIGSNSSNYASWSPSTLLWGADQIWSPGPVSNSPWLSPSSMAPSRAESPRFGAPPRQQLRRPLPIGSSSPVTFGSLGSSGNSNYAALALNRWSFRTPLTPDSGNGSPMTPRPRQWSGQAPGPGHSVFNFEPIGEHAFERDSSEERKAIDDLKVLSKEELDERYRQFKVKPILDGSGKKGGRITRARQRVPTCTECVFCKNNGESPNVYMRHVLKDPSGNVVCPVLRYYNCPICENGGGDRAHTVRYCPQNRPTFRMELINEAIGQSNNYGI